MIARKLVDIGARSWGREPIKVIGVGGGGCNAVNHMYQFVPIPGVDYACVDTDAAHLLEMGEDMARIVIGGKLTSGRDAGKDPEIGRGAAEESRDDLCGLFRGAEIVFVVAGMGGGTGSGAAPVIAEIAKETCALTIGIVTKPWEFEGEKRRRQAEYGVGLLKEKADSIIVIPIDKVLDLAGHDGFSTDEACRHADAALADAVKAMADLFTAVPFSSGVSDPS